MTTLHGVIPAVRKMKDFEKALQSSHEWIVLLETRLGQLKGIMEYTKRYKKKILLHIDLIQGLKADEYGIEFLAHDIRPDGIVSTRGSVVELAKKKNLLAVQRLFLLDSLSLENNLRQGNRFRADYIEVLPGKLPEVIEGIHAQTDIPIIAGGLLTSETDIDDALDAGAIAVSTSATELW
ncbi:MAG TPA: glycerol-3-phosphate responsive antiterminator [Pseudogracilibacillus sp.]|nr:glycerol-3-phosphate responsive antiterminator [Pseudogracilibacillus sp.]